MNIGIPLLAFFLASPAASMAPELETAYAGIQSGLEGTPSQRLARAVQACALTEAAAALRDEASPDAITLGDIDVAPLLKAVRCRNGITELLLARGAKPDGTRIEYEPLRWAIYNRNLDAARALIRYGAKVNPEGPERRSCLLIVSAIRQKDPAMVELLLDAGADIERPNTCHTYDVLSDAANIADAQVVRLLVTKRKVTRQSLQKALSVAACAKNPEVANVLIAAGAGLEQLDADGTNALGAAVSCLNIAAIKAYVSMGADPSAARYYGKDALQERRERVSSEFHLTPRVSDEPELRAALFGSGPRQ